MQLAIEQMRGEGAAERERIEEVLASKGFQEAGETAVYHCQCRALHLRPWEPPPCWAAPRADGPDDGVLGHRRAELLALRMSELGVSKFHPNPLKAIEEAEAKHAA